MVYVLGWALNYFGLFAWYTGIRQKPILAVGLLYMGVLIVIRYSGTDTFLYETALRAMLEGSLPDAIKGWEPAFVYLSKFFLWLTGSEVWAVRLIGLVFVFVLFIYLFGADRVELKLLFLYFIPVFVYAYGMNGVRAGLGMAFFLLSWQALRRDKWPSFLLLGSIALMFHYSMLLPLALMTIFRLKLNLTRAFATLIPILFAFFMIFLLRQEYFESKFALYTAYKSPSSSFGISRLILILLVWLAFSISKVPLIAKGRTFIGLVGLTVGFQVLALWSYAGLRFLDLMFFVTPLVLILEYERYKLSPSRAFWLTLGLAGLLGAAFAYRNFLSDFDGQLTGTPTPFLPYRTIFNYQP